jgi:hypothetical protein
MRLNYSAYAEYALKSIRHMLIMSLKQDGHAQHELIAIFADVHHIRALPTKIGFDGVINLELKFLCLGPFKTPILYLSVEKRRGRK